MGVRHRGPLLYVCAAHCAANAWAEEGGKTMIDLVVLIDPDGWGALDRGETKIDGETPRAELWPALEAVASCACLRMNGLSYEAIDERRGDEVLSVAAAMRDLGPFDGERIALRKREVDTSLRGVRPSRDLPRPEAPTA